MIEQWFVILDAKAVHVRNYDPPNWHDPWRDRANWRGGMSTIVPVFFGN